jgi:HAD superfamily hydrolase (TIGR01509 family)
MFATLASVRNSSETPVSSPVHSFDSFLPKIDPLFSRSEDRVASPLQAYAERCNVLILDLGDVLFTWSAETKTCISSGTLRQILRSASWFEYEKGNISEDKAYENAASEFGVPKSEIAAAFQGARVSLKSNEVLVRFVQELRAAYPTLKVFAMSNISAPDWEVLRTKATPEEWAIFDHVFTSAEARERKPNLGFYRRVLTETGVNPLRTVFVDDKLENVLSARSLGIKGVVFDSFENVAKQVRNYVEESGHPVDRAQAWLKANAKKMLSVTNNNVVLHENFTQLLILEVTGDRSLVEYVEHPRLFNFFQGMFSFTPRIEDMSKGSRILGKGVLTTADFPCDLDTTSIGLMLSTHADEAILHSVMDEILTYRNKDGIVQTYFDVTRPRIGASIPLTIRIPNTNSPLRPHRLHKCPHLLSRAWPWTRALRDPQLGLLCPPTPRLPRRYSLLQRRRRLPVLFVPPPCCIPRCLHTLRTSLHATRA